MRRLCFITQQDRRIHLQNTQKRTCMLAQSPKGLTLSALSLEPDAATPAIALAFLCNVIGMSHHAKVGSSRFLAIGAGQV